MISLRLLCELTPFHKSLTVLQQLYPYLHNMPPPDFLAFFYFLSIPICVSVPSHVISLDLP